ncbi:MAG: hypothetical protein AB7F23_02165 [Phycisphaerae bacterium]
MNAFCGRAFCGNPFRRSPVTVGTVVAMVIFTALATMCKYPQMFFTLSIPALQNMRIWTFLAYPLVQQGLSVFNL